MQNKTKQNSGEGLRTLNNKKKRAPLNVLLSFCQHNWKTKRRVQETTIKKLGCWWGGSGGHGDGGGSSDREDGFAIVYAIQSWNLK